MISYLEFMYKYEGFLLILVRDLSSGLEVENSSEVVIEWILDFYVMEMMINAHPLILPC